MKKFFLISVLFSIFLSFNVFGSDPQLTTTDVDGNPKSGEKNEKNNFVY